MIKNDSGQKGVHESGNQNDAKLGEKGLKVKEFLGNYTTGAVVFFLVTVYCILIHACFLPPLFPIPPGESVMVNRLDVSSIFIVPHFFKHNEIEFGRDIDWAYGPFGFLKLIKYHPDTFYWGILGRSFLALAFVVGCWRLMSAGDRNWTGCAMTGTFIAVISFLIRGDPYFQVIVLLMTLNYFFRLNGRLTLDYFILVVASALVTTVKVSYFSFAFIAIVAISISDIFEKKRIPWSLCVFAGGLVSFWVLAGQKIPNIFSYIAVIANQMGGYTDAMAAEHPTLASIYEIIGYVIASLVFLIFLWPISVRKTASRKTVKTTFFDLLPAGIVAVFLFIVFKHSFVRHDGHAIDAMEALIFLLFAGASMIVNAVLPNRAYFLFGLYVGLSVTTSAYIIHKYCPAFDTTAIIASPIREAKNLSVILTGGTTELNKLFETETNSYRRTLRLPPIIGTVDIYPDNMSVAAALNLSYSPRPGVVSHGAWNTSLLERGAARLSSPEGPGTIFFDIDTIDSHYPSIDDGVSWPVLLTHYDIKYVREDFLVLEKNNMPRDWSLEKIVTATTHFGETTVLSGYTRGDLLWARIKIEKTFLGRLMTTLFKTPELGLSVKLRGGSENKYRIIPEMVKAGFLLSPLVNSRKDFLDLASESRCSNLQQNEVNSLSFFIKPFYGYDVSSLLFAQNVQVELYKLNFIRQEDASLHRAVLQYSTGLESLYYGSSWYPYSAAAVRFMGEKSGKRVLLAHAPVKFKMPVSGKLSGIRIGFGILEQAYTIGNTDGVRFHVSAINEKGQEVTLFRRYLDPVSVNSDRGEQTALVEIPEGHDLAYIFLATEMGGNAAWDHSYWSNFAMIPKEENNL